LSLFVVYFHHLLSNLLVRKLERAEGTDSFMKALFSYRTVSNLEFALVEEALEL